MPTSKGSTSVIYMKSATNRTKNAIYIMPAPKCKKYTIYMVPLEKG